MNALCLLFLLLISYAFAEMKSAQIILIPLIHERRIPKLTIQCSFIFQIIDYYYLFRSHVYIFISLSTPYSIYLDFVSIRDVRAMFFFFKRLNGIDLVLFVVIGVGVNTDVAVIDGVAIVAVQST